MASQGPFFPTNAFNSGTGEQAWLNPTNIEVNDGTEAQVTHAQFDTNDLTQWLSGDNFNDFAIPAGATIDGLEFRVKRRAFAGGAVDSLVELFAGLEVSENKATATAWPSTATEVVYGGPTDTWGRAWTPAEINATNFGGLVQAKATANNTDVGIDYYTITVYYTDSGNATGSGSPTSTLSSSASGTATRTLNNSSGSGSPSSTLSSSASGTAVQSFSGSGSPSSTLSSSASGTAAQVFTGSGSPSSTLSSSASGAAAQSFSGSGTPSSTLSSSASGTATNTPDGGGAVSGSGSPSSTLSSSASGTATRTLNDSSGSGSPSSTLSSSASGTAVQSFSGSGSPSSTLSSSASGTASSLSFAPDPPAPLRTINVSTQAELVAAANNAQPGDLIVLAAGTYLGGIQMLSGIAGTAANPIVFEGPRTAIVDRNGSSAGFGFRIRGPFIQLRGFTVRNALFGVFLEQGTDGGRPTDCVLSDLEVRDAGQNTFVLRDADRTYVQRCDINNTGLSGNSGLGEGIYVGHSSDASQASHDCNILGNNFGPGVTGEHVDVKSPSARTVVRGNISDATGTLFDDAPACNGVYADQGGVDTRWEDNVVTGINSANLSGFFFFTAVRPNVRRNTVDPALNNITGGGFGFRVLEPTTDPAIYCDNIGTMNVSCIPVEVSSTGSGSPTDTLSSSASGTATNTPDPSTGSGSPSSTLVSTVTGSAIQADNTGSGSPTSTLSSSASGTATQVGDAFSGSGAPTSTLSSSASGVASLVFTGSGAPTSTLSSFVAGTASQVGFTGPRFIKTTGTLVATSARQVDWPGVSDLEEDSLVEPGDIALLIIGTKNEPVPSVTSLAGDPGDVSNFALIPESVASVGLAGSQSAVRVEVWWCRATSFNMAPVVIGDPGRLSVAAMMLIRGCKPTGNPWNAIGIGTVSPADTLLHMQEAITTIGNCLVVGASVNAIDSDIVQASGITNPNLGNLTVRNNKNFSTDNGIGLVTITGEKSDAGNYGDTTGTYATSARSAGVTIALSPPIATTASGSPSSTLSSSVSAVATSTPQNIGTGTPTSTLVSTASGTATQAPDILAGGFPTSTLSSTASGTATSTGIGQIDAFGHPVSTLDSTAIGIVSQPPKLYPDRPPRPPTPGGHGRGRRVVVITPDEQEKPRKRTRRRPAAPPHTPEAQPLPSFEAPPLPAFTPYQFDPTLWRSLAAPVRPTVPTPDPREIEEEERFLAQLLDLI